MFYKSIKDIMTYKPKKCSDFELTEDSQEVMETEYRGQSSSVQNSSSPSPILRNNNIVSTDLNANLETINNEFDIPNNNDIKIRRIKIARKVDAFIVYIDGMVNGTFISDFVIRRLMDVDNFSEYFCSKDPNSISDYICDSVITAYEISEVSNFNAIIFNILSGNSALFINESDQCLIIDTKGYEKRNVEKPTAEGVVLGSQEAFTENLKSNISLVRRIIKNQNLKTEIVKVSKTNQALCAIMYIDGIANIEVVKELKRRIESIDTDFIIGGGMLNQYIEENYLSPFPLILHTERPDRTSSLLMEGKVATIVEGTPFVDILPVTFFDFLHTAEDSMLRWPYGSFLRLIRVLGVLVTFLLPALYIALTLFHQEAVPPELLASMSISKEEVPFPTTLEVLLLEISFELIREGGIRVPGIIGQTLGIVGALILGQAAVAAKLVSPILIIVVAVTGLGSFAIPNYSLGLGVRILRFFFIFMASTLGFMGISEGIFFIGCILCSLKSFGVPYLSPIAPKTKSSADLIIRKPIWMQQQRPDYLNTPNRKRQGTPAAGWKKTGEGSGTK